MGATERECLEVAVVRDLVISASPTSDNLTPGETIGHDTPEVGDEPTGARALRMALSRSSPEI